MPRATSRDGAITSFRRKPAPARGRGSAMNVLHVMSNIDRKAGGPVVVTGLAAAQHRAGAHVTVLAVYAEGADVSIARELESTGVRVTLVGPVSARSAEARALKVPLAQAVATADVVHIH